MTTQAPSRVTHGMASQAGLSMSPHAPAEGKHRHTPFTRGCQRREAGMLDEALKGCAGYHGQGQTGK